MKEQSLSQVNTLADTLAGQNDGKLFTRQSPDVEQDPWGQPVEVAYAADLRTITVRSNGPDKLPHNSDDIVANRHIRDWVYKGVERGAEHILRGGVRGAVTGVRDGVFGKKEQ